MSLCSWREAPFGASSCLTHAQSHVKLILDTLDATIQCRIRHAQTHLNQWI